MISRKTTHNRKKKNASKTRSTFKTPSTRASAIRHRRQVPSPHVITKQNPVIKWGIVVLMIIFAFILARSCRSLFSITFDNNLFIKSENPYDWDNLSYDTRGRAHYIVDGEELSQTGVDVSSHQGTIDWNAVAQDNVQFAMIRAGYRGSTEGVIQADTLFETNLLGARNAGLSVGVYFFSQAITEDEAREEAQFVLQQLKKANVNSLELPVAFDLEPSPEHNGRADELSPAETNAIARAFCNEIQSAGYRVIVYGNKVDLNRFDLVSLNEPIWLAQYDIQPDATFNFLMWQYSSHGEVNGIDGIVDLNLNLSKIAINKSK